MQQYFKQQIVGKCEEIKNDVCVYVQDKLKVSVIRQIKTVLLFINFEVKHCQ